MPIANNEGKVDYFFKSFWDSYIAPWEKNHIPSKGTFGVIRFYNFDKNSAILKPGHISGFNWLGKLALDTSLQENDDEVLVIGSHSNTGDRNYNYQLSIRRAESVSRFLSTNGVPFSRMSILGSRINDRDSKGEQERFRAVSVIFTAYRRV